MKKICVLFPGMGYTNLKPLLYYSGKIALSKDYELKQISYMDMPSKVNRDPELMKLAYEVALAQSTEQLAEVDWKAYDEIVLVGKSVGTAVAASYARQYIMQSDNHSSDGGKSFPKVKTVYLTPLLETFQFVEESVGIAFHGNADPWAETDKLKGLSKESKIPLYIYEGGNHSLETGDVETDIKTLQDVMKKINEYLS